MLGEGDLRSFGGSASSVAPSLDDDVHEIAPTETLDEPIMATVVFFPSPLLRVRSL